MHRLLFFISFLFINLQLFAQENENIVVYGKVIDPAGRPVEGASVSDMNSSAFYITDINGFYKITLKPLPTTLKFTSIGFKTVKKNISSTKIKSAVKGQIPMDVQLEQATYVLSYVDISGKPYEWVYKNPDAWVIDFDFASDTSILLYMKEDHRHFLRLINEKNKVLLDYNINVSDAGFFKDCFGNIHLLTKDSAYQIYIYDTMGIYVYPAINRKLFISQLYPCVYSDSTSLIIKKYDFLSQSAFIAKINKRNKHWTFLYSVTNETNLNNAKDIISEINNLKRMGSSQQDNEFIKPHSEDMLHSELNYDPMAGFVPPENKNDQRIEDLQNTLSLYTTPITLDVYNINDSLYIFDFFNYKLKVFKNDSIEKRSINFDKDKFDLEHTKDYTDYEHKRIFLMNMKNAIANLKELNLSDLSIKSEFMISEHIYPQKIKIRGDYVYYLYGGVINDGEKFLYREKIKKQ